MAAIHITLASRANDGSLMGNSILYWIAICALLWMKRDSLNFGSSPISSAAGLLLIVLVLIKGTFISGFDPFLRLFPLISVLGLALLASGFNGLKQYWQELIICGFLVPPPSVLSELIDISKITAQLSTSILWYSGFDVSRQGVYILLPTGGIEVYSGCSGIENIFHLLGIVFIFLVTFSTSRIQKILVPLIAIGIAFITNSVRVAIMAALSASSNPAAFEYWHKGDGSLIFSMVAVLAFGLYCYYCVFQQEPETDEISQN